MASSAPWAAGSHGTSPPANPGGAIVPQADPFIVFPESANPVDLRTFDPSSFRCPQATDPGKLTDFMALGLSGLNLMKKVLLACFVRGSFANPRHCLGYKQQSSQLLEVSS